MSFRSTRKDTDDLTEELMSSHDLDAFLSENSDRFIAQNVSELLNELFTKTNLSKAELARRSGLSTVYLHQLFSGRRTPSRDRLICLAFGLGAPLETAQNLLKRSGMAPLYSKDRRDAIIIYGLINKMTVFEVNDRLFSADEETLF